VNYYPRDFAREEIWRQWPEAKQAMAADLERVRGLGANTVRLPVHPNVFGYPQPRSESLDDIEEALALVESFGLRVQLTLFACWWAWGDLEGSRSWLTHILDRFANDPRVVLWELYNEAPLDQPAAREWIRQIFPELKERVPGAATVSVNRVDWLADLRELTENNPVDVYNLHWYAHSHSWTRTLPADLDQALTFVNGTDLMLGEFGHSTLAASEARQRDLFRDVLYHASQRSIRHLGVWTLTDFAEGTGGCEGSPTPDGENYYGLFRRDGSPKPAAELVRLGFNGEPPSSPAPLAVPNASFEEIDPYSQRVDDWRSWDIEFSRASRFNLDCTVARTGRCSARVFGPTQTPIGLYAGHLIPVEREQVYALQGYARVDGAVGWVRLVLAWFDEEARWLGVDTRSPQEGIADDSGWLLLLTKDQRPPPGARYAQVYAQAYLNGPGASAWFDDISLIQAAG
jgi:hypothetical protein